MRKFLTVLAFLVLLPVAAQAAPNAPDEQRAGIQKMRDETLAKLYELQPDAKREIEDAAGYAVFSSGELALLWISGGYGHGIAHNNKNGADTYMQMAKAGLGLGLGAKDHNTVFVFHDLASLDNFINTGLDLTGTADAAAKVGGAADVLPGVRIYQITDSGLIAQAMVQGTKYWRDDSLN